MSMLSRQTAHCSDKGALLVRPRSLLTSSTCLSRKVSGCAKYVNENVYLEIGFSGAAAAAAAADDDVLGEDGDA